MAPSRRRRTSFWFPWTLLIRRQEKTLRTFEISILMVLVILVTGALGFYWLEGGAGLPGDGTNPDRRPRTILDAFYWAMVTISTTGYGDIIPQTDWGKAFSITFTTLGVLTLAWAGANALAFVVEGHLGLAFWERRMTKEIKTLKNHFIICGLGRVGKELVRQFRTQKAPYVVLDKSKHLLDDFLENDELRIVGDATDEDVLKEARVETARGLVTCMPGDAENVFTILTAKGLNSGLFIISRGQEETSRNKLMRAGADRVVMPSNIGARRMAAMVLRPAIIDFLDESFFVTPDKEPFLLEQIPVAAGNPFTGKMLKDSQIKSLTEVMILAIKTAAGEMVMNPPSTYVIREGDILFGLGYHPDFVQLRSIMKVPEERTADSAIG